jgi:hypothetical protein
VTLLCVLNLLVSTSLCPMPRQLDWGSRDDPCHSLTTEGDLPDITVEEWFHVGFTLSGGIENEGSAIIYVNGAHHASVNICVPHPRTHLPGCAPGVFFLVLSSHSISFTGAQGIFFSCT